MLRLAADENFNGNIIRGLLRRRPDLDIVRVQDVGLAGADDPAILAWAADEGRILLTHDVETMVGFTYEGVNAGLRMPGVFEVQLGTSIGQAIQDILLLVECSFEDEWEGRVVYIPLP